MDTRINGIKQWNKENIFSNSSTMEWNKHKKFPISKVCIDTLNRVHFYSSRRDYVAIVSYTLCTLYSVFIFYIPIFLLPIPVSISLQQVCRLHCLLLLLFLHSSKSFKLCTQFFARSRFLSFCCVYIVQCICMGRCML